MCRLNHELLPDPGKPIARTTVPLLGRVVAGAATVEAAWVSAAGVATA